MKKEWFIEWFDSPFYHLLYKNHDEQEAHRALDNLVGALDLPAGARILDLACGKGRHSRYLSEQGFNVTGLDISPSSIAYARQFEHEGLTFYQHDMRLPFRINYFDTVINMFTSFGYFLNERHHLLTLQNVARALHPGGLLLLDYFNSNWVRANLIPSATKTVEGVTFHLKKSLDDDHVFKTIEFEAGGQHHQYRERVRLFTLADFEDLFAAAGLQLRQTFGDYDLSAFQPADSKRLILVAERK